MWDTCFSHCFLGNRKETKKKKIAEQIPNYANLSISYSVDSPKFSRKNSKKKNKMVLLYVCLSFATTKPLVFCYTDLQSGMLVTSPYILIYNQKMLANINFVCVM